jgi:hypothetical protein
MKYGDIPKHESGIPLSAHPPLALDRFLLESGLSPVTAWRYRRKGWLKTVNICGRHYVTRESISEFTKRAEAGEFAKTPRKPGAT